MNAADQRRPNSLSRQPLSETVSRSHCPNHHDRIIMRSIPRTERILSLGCNYLDSFCSEYILGHFTFIDFSRGVESLLLLFSVIQYSRGIEQTTF